MPMITPIPARIEDILNAPAQYAIPTYQRDFKWGETEAREFIEDLNSYRGEDAQQLFLGNFIFEPTRDQKTHIIDGQQRLTSIMLLLIACRMRARALGLEPLAINLQGKLTFIDSTTAETLGCRLIASESVRDIFEYMANGNWTGDFPLRLNRRQLRRQNNRIRPIYEFFLNQISGFGQNDLSQFLGALYNTYVIQISIASDEEALRTYLKIV